MELIDSRAGQVGAFQVRRALPARARRTVGPWCFLDHFGPADVDEDGGLGVAPHPHTGLQTVTWLLEGEVLHRDSLGTEQVIRPGQLNLMTAGCGVSHAEEGTGRYRGPLHGVQLWVALPDATRDAAPAFEHHGDLPVVDLPGVTVTVLVGALASARSPARRDTDHVGAQLEVRGPAVLPLDPAREHAVVALDGGIEVDGRSVRPGQHAYLGVGSSEVRVDGAGGVRALLVGGEPFESPVVMWWNYVARTRDEITEAHRAWTERSDRFGRVASLLPPTDVPPPPWSSSAP
ncbi:MAG: pirin family protein [Acidimicrobiales bacterium]|nr:pirin family protein [Acidimicrobiales bacterium]